MGIAEWTLIGVSIFTVVVGVIGYLLSRKDEQQEKEIDALNSAVETLFKKHDADVSDLRDLREKVVGEHYRRDELDVKFEKLDSTFKDGFKDMGGKIDKLTDALITHLGEHTGKYPTGGKP